jgi:hypothetical protein
VSKKLLHEIAVARALNAVAAGTSDQTGTAQDLQGWEGVLFIAAVGALTATQITSLKAQASSDDAATDAYADISGAVAGPLTDTDGNKLLVLNVHRPTKRYVKPYIDRGTANAVIDGIFAIKYGPRNVPTSQDSTVMAAVAVADVP